MVAPPSFQFAGIAGLAEGVDYCGNAFGDVPPVIASAASAAAEVVAEHLRSRCYRGVVGLDLIADGKDCYALEINPRFQGSTWLLDELLEEQGLAPVAVLHVLALAGADLSGVLPTTAIDRGAQVIARAPVALTGQAVPRLPQGGYAIDDAGQSPLSALGPR